MSSDPLLFDVYPPLTRLVHALPSQLDADRIARSRSLLPFEISLAHQTVHYTALDPESKSYLQHVRYLVQSIYKNDSSKPCCWQKIAEYLRSSNSTPKNVNNKTSFRYQDHIFLTKPCFTTGLRCVDASTVHLLQIGHHALYLYYVEAARAETTVFCKNLNCFSDDDESRFARVELQRYTKYAIPAGTYYVLNSACKTFFSLHIVPPETYVDYQFLFIENLAADRPYERFQRAPSQLDGSWEEESPSTPRIEEVAFVDRTKAATRPQEASAPADEEGIASIPRETPEKASAVWTSGALDGTRPDLATPDEGRKALYATGFREPCLSETAYPSAMPDRTEGQEDRPTDLSACWDPPCGETLDELIVDELIVDESPVDESPAEDTSLPMDPPAEPSFPAPLTLLSSPTENARTPLSDPALKRMIAWYQHLQSQTYGPPVEVQRSTDTHRAFDLRIRPYSPISSPASGVHPLQEEEERFSPS